MDLARYLDKCIGGEQSILPKGGAFGVMKPVDMELLLKLAEAQDSEGGGAGLCSTSSWSSSTSAGAKKTRSMILKDLGLTEKNGARGTNARSPATMHACSRTD